MADENSHDQRVNVALERIRAATKDEFVRTVMSNAQDMAESGRLTRSQAELVQRAGWRRLAELAGQVSDEPLVRRWHEGIAAFEEFTGRRAARTRQMLNRHGVQQAFTRLVDRPHDTVGFTQMIQAGLHDMTAEWIVLEFPHVFAPRIRDLADQRLKAAGVLSRP